MGSDEAWCRGGGSPGIGPLWEVLEVSGLVQPCAGVLPVVSVFRKPNQAEQGTSGHDIALNSRKQT